MLPASLTGKRVLLVEDEMLIALDIEQTLRASGCEVVGPFADVAAALSAAESRTLDAGVLDVNICGANTFAIARRLERRGIPFVFLNGYSRDLLAPENPEWEVFEKPYGLERLLARLREKMAAP
jgi:DNA-binding response OmpR family regulator